MGSIGLSLNILVVTIHLTMLKIVSLLLLLLCVSDAVEASRLHNGYKYFFLPELKQILNANPVCIKEYELYRTESTPLYGKQCVKVFSCIMKDASEYALCPHSCLVAKRAS